MSPQLLTKTGVTHVLTVGSRPWPPSEADIDRAVKASNVTKSVRDPSEVYPQVDGLPNTYETFRLSCDGLTDDEREQALTVARSYHTDVKSLFMGFQVNHDLHYSKDFTSYLDTHVSNLGDPYKSGNYTMNSKFMERPLLDYFAALWNARWPHDSSDPESYWGFSLTMGSTEGNLYAMWNARDYLGGKKISSSDTRRKRTKDQRANCNGANIHSSSSRLVYNQTACPDDKPHAYTPIAFYSEDTHYSIAKAMTMLEIPTFYEVGNELYRKQCPLAGSDGDWPREVPSLASGAIDIGALEELVRFFAKEGYPILVCFNYGTTFKGAYDDVEAAGKRLVPILEENGLHLRKVHHNPENQSEFDCRTGFWFHVDGALGAAYMPFIEMAYNANLTDQRGPIFDFRLPFVHSISTSGHKWIGAPLPCGLFMTKVKYQMLPPLEAEHIEMPDMTFAGSRNGLSPMLLWNYIARQSYGDHMKTALRLEAMTQYTERRLNELGRDLKTDLWVARTALAFTVRFKQASDAMVLKYSLSNKTLGDRAYSHVFVMGHITIDLVEELIFDLSQEGAFLDQSTTSAEAASTPVNANKPPLEANGHSHANGNGYTQANGNGHRHANGHSLANGFKG